MSNWAEDMLDSIETEIKSLELLEKKESDEENLKKISSMKAGLQKQCLDLYRHAVKEGSPFDLERLKKYESYHQQKKLYLSDPHLEERHISPIMRTKSAEEEMIHQMDEQEKKREKKREVTIDLSFLSKRQQETIQLYADGLTYSDIADLIGVKKGTVSKHLQLARAKAKAKGNITLQIELNMDVIDEPTPTDNKNDKQRTTARSNRKIDEPTEEQLTLPIKIKRKKVSK